MDITAILSGIKGKVLDAQHFDLLKHAYDLQNQNIEQLKTNNEALREKAQLLGEHAVLLTRENEALKATVETLQSKLHALPQVGEVSEDEKRILVLLSSREGLTAREITETLGLNRVKTDCYLRRMWRKYIRSRDWSDGRESLYYLDQGGRVYLMENGLLE